MTASADTHAVEHAPARGRAPEFFIVGHHKCGTTAMYEMLRRHPQIYMPDVKEPWFFARDLTPRFPASTWLPETLDEYLTLFTAARPNQRIGEATPSYLMSHTAAASIADVQPDARIIAILREPASFIRSLHMQSVENHAETETNLRKALALEEPRRRGEAIPREAMRPGELLYADHVKYVEQLRRYHAVFSPEQVLVLIYEDFRQDNDATMRRVLRFLEVDDDHPIEPIEMNPTVSVRSRRVYEAMRSVYLGRGPAARVVNATLKAAMPRSLRLRALTAVRHRLIYRKPAPADDRLMLELRRRFEGEVLALSEYLGRDLTPLWGYDQLG